MGRARTRAAGWCRYDILKVIESSYILPLSPSPIPRPPGISCERAGENPSAAASPFPLGLPPPLPPRGAAGQSPASVGGCGVRFLSSRCSVVSAG